MKTRFNTDDLWDKLAEKQNTKTVSSEILPVSPPPTPSLKTESNEHAVVLRDDESPMRLRLRRLQEGERLRNGDVWLDPRDGTLRELPHRWWRAFIGRVGPDSVEHYRIAP